MIRRHSLTGRERKYKLEMLFERRGKRCEYCGKILCSVTATIDHKHPQCLGGSHRIKNLTIACQLCNADKGGEAYSEYVNVINVKNWELE